MRNENATATGAARLLATAIDAAREIDREFDPVAFIEAEYQKGGDEPLLTISEVMQWLRSSRMTLWRLERQNHLVPLRIGSSVRYRPADVREFLEGNRNRNIR
jgi:predicted DNA-binding transcriptional regulator AlpA